MIKTHHELAKLIVGKKILHLNSLGKDSILCLEWLCSFAKPSKITSVFFEFLACHPADKTYLAYLKKRYPKVEFISLPNSIELSLITDGVYQSPIEVMSIFNKFEHSDFDRSKQVEELKKNFDYVCDGSSKYESFARRTKFHQKGLEFKGTIYPLGMMSKAQVIGLIKQTGIKLHPAYKFAKSSYDHPSYWKMRSGMIANSKFKENLLRIYPLLALDIYRYERLLK